MVPISPVPDLDLVPVGYGLFGGWFWVEILKWLQTVVGGHRYLSNPWNVASLIDDFTY